MSQEMTDRIEQSLRADGFGGVRVRVMSGVATLGAALPATDEALAALEAAWNMDDGEDTTVSAGA